MIFVHGCFWHRHKGCKDATTPKTNKAFWQKKFERNVANDKKHARALKKLGWKVIIVWECQLKKPDNVLRRLERFLATPEPTAKEAGLPEAGRQRSGKKREKSQKVIRRGFWPDAFRGMSGRGRSAAEEKSVSLQTF